jgi:hypothetical protein
MKPLKPDTLKITMLINCNEAFKTRGNNAKRNEVAKSRGNNMRVVLKVMSNNFL